MYPTTTMQSDEAKNMFLFPSEPNIFSLQLLNIGEKKKLLFCRIGFSHLATCRSAAHGQNIRAGVTPKYVPEQCVVAAANGRFVRMRKILRSQGCEYKKQEQIICINRQNERSKREN